MDDEEDGIYMKIGQRQVKFKPRWDKKLGKAAGGVTPSWLEAVIGAKPLGGNWTAFGNSTPQCEYFQLNMGKPFSPRQYSPVNKKKLCGSAR